MIVTSIILTEHVKHLQSVCWVHIHLLYSHNLQNRQQSFVCFHPTQLWDGRSDDLRQNNKWGFHNCGQVKQITMAVKVENYSKDVHFPLALVSFCYKGRRTHLTRMKIAYTYGKWQEILNYHIHNVLVVAVQLCLKNV